MSEPMSPIDAATAARRATNPPRPMFFDGPIRYMRYTSRVYPALFWSVILGSGIFVVPWMIPLREAWGYNASPALPRSYPIPNRRRTQLASTYDD